MHEILGGLEQFNNSAFDERQAGYMSGIDGCEVKGFEIRENATAIFILGVYWSILCGSFRFCCCTSFLISNGFPRFATIEKIFVYDKMASDTSAPDFDAEKTW